MLVIEGADCTGKTTLCKQLWSHPRLQELGMEIQHLSRLPTGHDRTWHYVDRMNVNGIFDRFYLSEIAYAQARGDDVIYFDQPKLTWVHAQAQIRGAYTVLLTASDDVIESRWNKDEMYPIETVFKANACFERLWAFADVKYSQYHPGEFLDTEAVEFIISQYLERRSFIESLCDR